MNVKLLAHTQLSDEFLYQIAEDQINQHLEWDIDDSKCIALSAIRTCYSPNKPSEIIGLEGGKYFSSDATDGEGGKEADRLIRHIVKSGHTSTLEHINYTFSVEGVSRSLLAQLTRHRQFSFSVQSQRYVKFGSEDKSGGFEYVVPPSIEYSISKGELWTDNDGDRDEWSAGYIYFDVMEKLQSAYDTLRKLGVPAEDARFVLPNAASCNLVLTANLRAILEFYGKRQKGKGAQWEIAEFAEKIKEEVIKVDSWVESFFE